MPWVRLDDRFPSHRKVALLSDRAFRLYVSALCWSSENLTEGRILDKELPLISRVRGVKTVAKELEDARLWDRIEGGWEIHDYLEYNPDRARVQADRAANAARQKAFRERKRAEREAARKAEEDAARNAPRNAVTDNAGMHDGDTTDARRRHDGDTNATRTRPENQSSPQVNPFRNGVSNGPPSPSPSRPVPPTEVPPPPPPSNGEPGTDVVAASGRGEVQPLIDAMAARGMNVSWTFSSQEWLELRDAIRRVGVPTLVDHAARAWTAAKNQPYSARYFLTGWTGLHAPPAYTGPRPVAPPSPVTEYLEDMAAIAEEMRQKKTGGA
ncbi:hypothetical protein [Streptomyces sp. CNQ085]|uniref:hypothetical protein n=1 Tax=Streptomyces sp. CNQ085 TaxID=2886944 RepID=UPI001F50FD2A|nr:hypothetical protein [Streptomyces sp. CNQ085]MCI0386192.1 hypothetical protein [Streptomyces sp. CNQ085]